MRIHWTRSEGRSNGSGPNGIARLRLKKATLYHHGGIVLFGAFILSIILFIGGFSMLRTHNSINASRSAFIVLDKSLDFTEEYAQTSADFQIVAILYGYIQDEDNTQLFRTVLDLQIELKIDLFYDLKKRYRHHKKKTPELRKANSKFADLTDLFDQVIQADYTIIEALSDFRNSSSGLSFDAFIEEHMAFSRGLEEYTIFHDALSKFTNELEKISVDSQTDTQRITLAVQFLLFIVLLILGVSLYKNFKESSTKLAAQDKLLRQQMHEARNKFCPAMYMMEQFLETAHKKDATVRDFTSLADDMHMALVALKEVEAQHQARLDMYKILQGKYVANKETFDILELMQERSAVERTVALARARATNSPIASFVSAIEDANNPERNTCGALFIQTDLYILNHVIANLLSNARKFCSSGEIKLSFNGTNAEDLLVFSVRDSGSGLPASLLDGKTLFSKGSISGDTRGTGLGLPSCDLFCKAGGGYIRLAGSKMVDEHSSGYTEFEFALKGKVIRVDTKRPTLEDTDFVIESPNPPSQNDQVLTTCPVQTTSVSTSATMTPEVWPSSSPRRAPPTCPDNVQVIAIDDSALNRTCVIRTFKKIERASNARHWDYKEYETIESSMPFFRELQDTSKVIVLLDENLNSRGGVLLGIQGTRWLLHELHFSGLIISTSGDPDVGSQHLQEGPNVLNWGKPLPKFEKMLDAVTKAFAPTMFQTTASYNSTPP